MDNIQKKTYIVAWLVSKFAAEKNKLVITILLMFVMGFMWFKVLTKDSPSKAAAAQNAQTNSQKAGQTSIEYLELQVVEGKHDKLSKDFFSPVDFAGFKGNVQNFNQVVSGKNGGSVIEDAAEKLNLGAILDGQDPEVFINDSLLKVGEKISVERNGKVYEFELVKIMRNKARLKCNDTYVVISIADANMEQ